ncbi:probable UDP-sugar transporter protein SLC35A4 [Penaeus vannamei]|uniref:probable UDP-sugar transporter protein SLC35A4 n=1 Tax=Penaeus vannamei TaxID=6689 RepID=UPI00387F928A
MLKTTLERTGTLRTSLALIGIFLTLEVSKQLSNFGLMKSPKEQRPLTPSLLVVLVEVVKMLVVVVWQISRDSPKPWRASLKFAIPAVCYLVNNSLHLNALAVTSPPVWLVLVQTRTLFTALAYKFVFGRELRWKQGLGCVLVVSSIVLTKFSSLREDRNTISSAIFVRSQISALLSSTASLTIETLLKNDGRSFVEQQVWLYLWGTLLGITTVIYTEDLPALVQHLETVSWAWPVWALVGGAVTSSALAGLCIPQIVKRLDTVVKDYLVALNNLVLGGVTAVIFPSEFSFDWHYLLSLAVLVAGIFLYEKKH